MKIQQANRLDGVKTYYFAKKLAEVAMINRKDETQILNLGIGSPDLAPSDEVIDMLQTASALPDANKYQSYRGIPELRSAFSVWYADNFNVSINADSEVLPLMGSKEGIMHIHMSLLNPGDQVLVPNPGYPAYSMTAKIAGAEPVLYDLTEESDWLPDLDQLSMLDLEKVKIMWLNYPHMPTGASASLDIFQRIVDFGAAHDIIICHDNPYSFILNDNPLSIMQINGAREQCIELVSLSKCYNMAGWRIGGMIAHPEMIDTVLKFKSNMDSGMYKPMQLAAAKALVQDNKWLAQLNATYRKRRTVVYEIMDLLDASYQRDTAGMFVWAKISNQTSDQLCDELLHNAKVFITPGHIFGSKGDGYIRISLCNPINILQMAKNRIENLLIHKIPTI